MTSVAVVGAGVIGVGVAQRLAQAGHRTLLVDVSEGALERAERSIRDGVRMSRLFGGAKEADPEAVLRRVTFTTEYQELSAVDFVIENVSEDWATKRDVYRLMDQICAPHCIFAPNTSAIPITRIAEATARPPLVIGLHFMNPVPLKPIVEVIPGSHTSPETTAAAEQLLATMGMDTVVVRDSPGFVSNRVLMLTINEAIFLVHEQVATAEQIDRLFRASFGHKMGPLETADLIGLDTVLSSIEVLQESFNDDKYRPCPLLRQMVDAGLNGKKAGHGFYSYGLREPQLGPTAKGEQRE